MEVERITPVGPVSDVLSGMPDEVAAVRAVGFEAIRRGAPADAAAVAAASGIDRARILEGLELMGSVGAVTRDASGRIAGVGGLTTLPTRHSLVLDGVALHTWCAIDAVGIPAALEADAEIVTTCEHCGTEHRLRSRAGRLDGAREHVFWCPTSPCSNLSAGFCTQANLYCGRDHADAWRDSAGNPEGAVLSVDDVEELGRRIWRDGLDPALRVRTD